MKPAKLIFSALLTCGAASLFAQTGAQDGSKFGKGEDSIRCIKNISLYEPYAKAKNYKDALEFWELAYAECPASSKNLYINGAKILEWQIKNEKDPAKRDALVEKLMGLYDNRIKYFGDDRQYPASRIMGNKGVDYVTYMGAKADLPLAYKWLTESVDARKGTSSPEVIKEWVSTASKIYKANPSERENYINTYMKGVEYLDEYMKSAKGAMVQYTEQVKTYLGQEFAMSGAADCDALQAMYGPKLDENKDNIAYLKQAISLLRRSKCQETEAYFLASDYAHRIEPTMDSALGLGKQAYKKEDYPQAIAYFEEAAKLATEPADKAEIDLNIASIYFKRRNYPQARTYANRSLESDPNQATPYILIANMYANDAHNIYPNDPIMAQAVYFAAVDKLERAKSAEPNRAGEINSLISSYRQRFPSVQDVFMHQELEKGKTITIGGWIQERTTVR
ncbi:MAG: tetratricopeptide repeat protein [Bacteroidales bacterium]